MSSLSEERIKHLEFIQGVINRLSTNSFLLKGWTVVIVAALLSFSFSEGSIALATLTMLPLAVFWGLDGFFLWEERKYRKLYDLVRSKNDENVDFSMSTEGLQKHVGNWFAAMFSKTLIPFHGVLLVANIAAIIFEKGSIDWLDESFLAFTSPTTAGEQHK